MIIQFFENHRERLGYINFISESLLRQKQK